VINTQRERERERGRSRMGELTTTIRNKHSFGEIVNAVRN